MDRIVFKPLTDGLGFHPFSDGLPYAPVTKAPGPSKTQRFSQGTGAVAAGPATFAKVTVPIAPAMKVKEKEKEKVAEELVQAFEPTFGFVYLLKRVIAHFVDLTFNFALCAGALGAVLWRQGFSLDSLLNPGVVILGFAFLSVFSWALVVAQEVAFGTSLGKRIFGLALQGSPLAIFARAIFFIPSSVFCGLGLFWALFNRRKRCWHDLVVNAQPIEIAKL